MSVDSCCVVAGSEDSPLRERENINTEKYGVQVQVECMDKTKKELNLLDVLVISIRETTN